MKTKIGVVIILAVLIVAVSSRIPRDWKKLSEKGQTKNPVMEINIILTSHVSNETSSIVSLPNY